MTESISRITSKGRIYDIADLQARVKLDSLEEEINSINLKASGSESNLNNLIEELEKHTYERIKANVEITWVDDGNDPWDNR